LDDNSWRGGSKIGWVSASWPFAKLTVAPRQLTLSTLETLVFSPEQVIALEPCGSIPVLASGVRIVHTRSDCPQTVIFWYLGRRATLLERIREAGFIPAGSIGSFARAAGMPIRWSVIIIFLLLWNGLFLLDRSVQERPAAMPGPVALLALFGIFSLSWGTLVSRRLQALVLRDGHGVGEIRSFLVLLLLVAGALAIGFTIAWFGSANLG
jgi:hypothetical protein